MSQISTSDDSERGCCRFQASVIIPLPTLVSLQSAFGNALFIGITGLRFAFVRCFRMDAGNAF